MIRFFWYIKTIHRYMDACKSLHTCVCITCLHTHAHTHRGYMCMYNNWNSVFLSIAEKGSKKLCQKIPMQFVDLNEILNRIQ